MPTTDFSFTSVLTYNGSNYGDMTLEAQKPGGTSFGAFVETTHMLYLGHDSKFDMAIFDIDTAGNLGTLKYEYYNGSAWTEFIPLSYIGEQDPDGDLDTAYDFSEDGAEIFPLNRLDNWSTVAIDSKTKYWVRISSPTSVTTAPTFKRIQMRPIAAYCTSKDIYEMMQLAPVLGGTDFTSSTTPTQATVDDYINRSQSYIDYKTRKSWRPNIVYSEIHEFNLSGIKLDRADAYKILKLQIWDGNAWETKTQGRSNDYFLVADTGIIMFARQFLLPSKLYSQSTLLAGEFSNRVRITYLAGRDLNFDSRENGIVYDSAIKLSCIDITRSADFGGAVVSGMDRVSLSQRVEEWKREIDEQLESLTAFEVF